MNLIIKLCFQDKLMLRKSTGLRQTLKVHANLNSHLYNRTNFILQINLLHLTGNSIRSIEINDVNSINKIRKENFVSVCRLHYKMFIPCSKKLCSL